VEIAVLAIEGDLLGGEALGQLIHDVGSDCDKAVRFNGPCRKPPRSGGLMEEMGAIR
jgi:hypothetical protein